MAPDVRDDVAALVRDLLPILVPGATFDAESAAVLLPVGDGRARASIDSLVAACRDQPNHTWPRLVDRWLTDLRASVTDAAAADRPVTVERLRIQIAPRRVADDLAGLVVLPYGGFFDARVVVDHPNRVEALTAGQAAALGLDADRAANAAIQRTIAEELRHLEVREHDVGGARLHLVARDGSPYVTSVLLSVDRFVPGSTPHGVLVAAPRYSAVILHRVESEAALDVAVVVSRLAGQMYREAPDPCTDRVFWWVDGTLYPIEVVATDDPRRPRVSLPPELAPVVERLPARPTP